MEKMKIEIWSDVVCPFCYIGKQKLEQALFKTNLKDQVEVVWHSFQLDPDFPTDKSYNASEYLGKKKGWSKDDMKDIYAQLASQAKPYGIDFQFEKCLSFNTAKAHTLLQWSKEFGKSTEFKIALFKAYFTQGIDLAIEENLLNVVGEVGLDKKMSINAFKDVKYIDKVYEDQREARHLGVRGVPYFLVGGKQTISGATDDSVFERTLLKAHDQWLKTKASNLQHNDGAVCTPQGQCD